MSGIIAFQFPGQGSQAVGMGADLADAYPEARALFDEADEVLGFELSRLCWEGPEEKLRATENAQPALLTHGVAAARVLASLGLKPSAAAGHSLGEFTAHVIAGSLAFADALRLVRVRGEAMAMAGRQRPGTMAAIIGLDEARVALLCEEAREEGEVLVAANYNSPGQIVISGSTDAVRRVVSGARQHGARMAIELQVSGAFHSPLMAQAVDALREALDATLVRPATIPVVANVDAAKAFLGGLNAAINCAGILGAGRVLGKDGAMPLAQFQTTVLVNLVGSFNVAKAAAALIQHNEAGVDGERGVIVNTASVAAYEGQIGQAAYSASKGGVVGMTLPMARECRNPCSNR